MRVNVACLLDLVALLALLIPGCATPTSPVIPGAKKDLLAFLHTGKTTREEVLATLDQPSKVFEQDRILTYWVSYERGQGYYIVSPPKPSESVEEQFRYWQTKRYYSLVLVFDANGVLRESKLVNVKRYYP
jgi:hypothetical protein